ncbi:hypothetical protein T4C_13692 [Trichinella pseudospiralis]|uniref:Uncharacterized protein n=1 Tax=Trichinella pseudospiralis TaxID=6337 RepID=A0A0V1IPT0_TRIPS|nr:hypothetical protein T4C_13692 [Trichinella pseudospiralis]
MKENRYQKGNKCICSCNVGQSCAKRGRLKGMVIRAIGWMIILKANIRRGDASFPKENCH